MVYALGFGQLKMSLTLKMEEERFLTCKIPFTNFITNWFSLGKAEDFRGCMQNVL